jgi:hypothetical protein
MRGSQRSGANTHEIASKLTLRFTQSLLNNLTRDVHTARRCLQPHDAMFSAYAAMFPDPEQCSSPSSNVSGRTSGLHRALSSIHAERAIFKGRGGR